MLVYVARIFIVRHALLHYCYVSNLLFFLLESLFSTTKKNLAMTFLGVCFVFFWKQLEFRNHIWSKLSKKQIFGWKQQWRNFKQIKTKHHRISSTTLWMLVRKQEFELGSFRFCTHGGQPGTHSPARPAEAQDRVDVIGSEDQLCDCFLMLLF